MNLLPKLFKNSFVSACGFFLSYSSIVLINRYFPPEIVAQHNRLLIIASPLLILINFGIDSNFSFLCSEKSKAYCSNLSQQVRISLFVLIILLMVIFFDRAQILFLILYCLPALYLPHFYEIEGNNLTNNLILFSERLLVFLLLILCVETNNYTLLFGIYSLSYLASIIYQYINNRKKFVILPKKYEALKIIWFLKNNWAIPAAGLTGILYGQISKLKFDNEYTINQFNSITIIFQCYYLFNLYQRQVEKTLRPEIFNMLMSPRQNILKVLYLYCIYSTIPALLFSVSLIVGSEFVTSYFPLYVEYLNQNIHFGFFIPIVVSLNKLVEIIGISLKITKLNLILSAIFSFIYLTNLSFMQVATINSFLTLLMIYQLSQNSVQLLVVWKVIINKQI